MPTVGAGGGEETARAPAEAAPERSLTRTAEAAMVEQLRATVGKFELAFDAIDDAIVLTDKSGRVEWCNAMFAALTGAERAETAGADIFKLLPLKERGREVPPEAHPGRLALANTSGIMGSYSFERAGRTLELEIYAAGIHFRKHAASAALVIRDVTERAKNEAKFRSLLEAAPDAMVIADAEGRMVLVNAQALAVFGYAREELVGQRVEMLMPERFRAGHVAKRDGYAAAPRVRPMGSGLELFGRRKDGTCFPVEISLSPLKTDEGAWFMAAIRDVTERKRAEAAQNLSDQRFRALVQGVKDYAIMMLDPQGRVSTWNPGAERLKGYKAEEIVGAHFSKFYVPEDADAGMPAQALEAAATSGRFEETRWSVRKDGTRFWGAVVITALKDEAGRLVGFAKVTRDLTAQREADQAVEKAQAEAAAAYRELEVFSYSVAHDLRAPLRKIDGYGAVLEEHSRELDDDGRDCLRRMRAASRNMSLLIDDLLKLASLARGEVVREEVDLSELAGSVAAALRESAPERDAEFAIQPGLRTKGDPGLLRDVLENLMGNSWKFTSKHPRARIEFGAVENEGGLSYFVRDDGAGFDPAYAAKLFAPFQRLHGVAEFPGTGIGLAVVARIVRLHGGRIWAEGGVEQGATLRFTLWSEGGTNGAR